MAAGFDNSGSHTLSNNTAITISDFVVSSGLDRLLVVSVGAEDSAVEDTVVSSITFDSDNFIQVRREVLTGGNNIASEMWYLLLPNVTTSDITATFAGTCSSLKISAMSFTGVKDQSEEAEAGGTASGETEIPSGATITTITDNALIVVEGMHSQTGTWTEGTEYTLGLSTSGNASSMGDEYDLDGSTAGSKTVDMTKSGSAGGVTWIALAFEIASEGNPKGPLGHPLHGALSGPIG